MKRKILCALCAFLLVFSLALCANAAVVDKHTKGSITLTMRHKGKPIPGGSMSLYYVADITEANGVLGFAYIEAFRGCTADLSGDLTSAATAQTIELYTAAHDETIVPTHKKNIDKNGRVRFDGLKVGLYLLVQHDAAPGYSTVSAFLLSVPQLDGDVYDYDVDAAPKTGSAVPEKPAEPTQPSTPSKPPKPPKPTGNLPQTGQLNWPVPVLTLGGLLLFALGWYLNASGKRKTYEKQDW